MFKYIQNMMNSNKSNIFDINFFNECIENNWLYVLKILNMIDIAIAICLYIKYV